MPTSNVRRPAPLATLTRRKTAPMLGALAVAALLSGCAATAPTEPPAPPTHLDLSAIDVADSARNGIEYVSGADALTATLRAARAAKTVTMTGVYTRHPVESDDAPTVPGGTLDVQFSGSASAFTARIASGDRTVDFIGVDGDRYLREDEAAGFSCYAASAPQVTEWGALLDPITLIDELFSGATLAMGAAGESTVDVLIEANGGTAGSLTVAAIDRALPSRALIADEASSVLLDFAEWGAERAAPAVPAELLQSCD